MDLFIQTLIGSGFEIKVSPSDTIMAVKVKIQDCEGIPISQQHLLYQLEELEDSKHILDYPIQNGSTLKLVLALRGGPVNAQRMMIEDDEDFEPERLQELLQSLRDEVFGNVPQGSRVSMFVYRDGDYLNLIRVVEKEIGAECSLPDSWSGSSVQNLLAGISEDPVDPPETPCRSEEYTTTMVKLTELRKRMGELSLQRKPKKLDPEPNQPSTSSVKQPTMYFHEETPRPLKIIQPSSSEDNSTARSRNRQTFVLPPIQRTEIVPAIPTRSQHSLTSREFLCNAMSRRSKDIEKKVGRRDINCNTESRPSGLAKGDSKKREKLQSLPSLKPKSQIQTCRRIGGRVSGTIFPDLKPQRHVEQGASKIIRKGKGERNVKQLIDDESTSSSNDYVCTSSVVTVEEESESGIKKERPRFSLSGSQIKIPSKEAATIAVSPIPRERAASIIRSGTRFVLGEDDRPKSTPKKYLYTFKCESEADWHRVLRRPHRNNSSADVSPNVPRTADGEFSLKSSDRLTQDTNSSRVGLSTSCTSTLVDVGVGSPQFSHQNFTPASNNTHSSENKCVLESFERWKDTDLRNDVHRPLVSLLRSEESIVSQESSRPAVLPTVKKHSMHIRCAVCKKRLNITNQFTCRCEKFFCSAHRYSELHNCSFDYKAEGRKVLEQSNPLVTAPKLPKI